MASGRCSHWLRWLERILLSIAALTFGIVGADFVRAERDAISARRVLENAYTAPVGGGADGGSESLRPAEVMTLPAGNELPPGPLPRTSATLLERPLVGELQIPRVELSTMVFEVHDAAELRHAAGHVRGTPLPWQEGNSAVAGHRDSAFRRLRDVRPGDDIRFITPRGTFDYRVTRAFVVYPNEVWVLRQNAAALTLITCFPFRWVGTAPERWVIQASRTSS